MSLLPVTPEMKNKAANMAVEYDKSYEECLQKIREERTKEWKVMQEVSRSKVIFGNK